MSIRVNGPGFSIKFPDGTDKETIDRVMHEAHAKHQTPGKKNPFMELPVAAPQNNPFMSLPAAAPGQLPPGRSPKLVPVDHDPFAAQPAAGSNVSAKGDRQGAAPDFAKIKRNVQRMIDQNAPEADIDAYVASEGVTAEQLRAAPKLVPVDHDPFAPQPTRLKEFRTKYPQYDEMSDADLAKALHRKYYSDIPFDDFSRSIGLTPSTGAGSNSGAQAVPQTQGGARPAQTQPDTSFGRGLALGTQDVGKGLANVAGAPNDIATLILNGLAGGANVTGDAIETLASWAGRDFEIPDIPRFRSVVGGEQIADYASQATEALGGRVFDESERTPRQKLLGNLVDFGTQASAGGAGLTKAAAVKSAPVIEQGASSLGRMLAELIPNYITNPYKAAPGRMLVTDTAGGVGSGAALSAADEYLPEPIAKNPFVRFVASLLGGGAGASAIELGAKLPTQGIGAITEQFPAPAVFQDPNAVMPVSKRTANQAIDFVHQNATNPKSALGQLLEQLNFYADAGGAMPTTGLMTDDTGLQLLDRKMRDQYPKPFIERDKAVRDSAFRDVENLRPDDADPYKPRQVSEQEIAARTGAANEVVRRAKGDLETAQKAETELGDTYAQPPMNREEASTALDKALIQDIGIPMRARKGDLYKSIDPNGTEMLPTDDLVALAKQLESVGRSYPPSTRSRMAPEGLIWDIKAYEPKIDPKTGENIGGPGRVSFKNLNEWRKPLSEMENEARRAGQFGIADGIAKIRRTIGEEGEALAASGSPAGERASEANRFYKEDYRPFREGPVGDLMREVARDPLRDRTPASATANRLVVKGPGAPEAGRNVNEAISRGSPEAQGAAREAIKNYFLADLRNVVRDGKVSETRLAAWIKNNESTLAAYPGFKKEVTDLLDDVRGRGARTSNLKAELEIAEAAKVATEKDLAKSGFAIFAGREPEKAVAALFAADDPVSAVKQLRSKFAGNKEADAGLRAMVADHIIDQVQTTGKAGVTGDASPLSLAKIESVFRRNERLLKEVFGSDIQYLNQARRRLEALSRRANQATPGSSTVERTGVDRAAQLLLKPAEIIAKLAFGQLQGGGYTRSARLLAEQMPDSTSAARQLIFRMSFDPELAKHILSATPKAVTTPRWNKKLNRLMGWAELSRSWSNDDED